MPHSSISGSVSSPQVDVVIDMGNPLLNLTVDGFLKIGAVISQPLQLFLFLLFLKQFEPIFFFFFFQVAATRALAEDTYHIVRKGMYFSTFAITLLLKSPKDENFDSGYYRPKSIYYYIHL